MKFGFDIDDTLIQLRQHAFHIYNEKMNKQIELAQFHTLKTLEIHEPFGLTAEEGGRLWKSLREEIYFSDCPPFPNAVEVLNRLVKEGHEIYYITARDKQYAEGTKEWLIKNGFPVDEEKFYCGMKDEEKIKIIQEMELDYYFDDKPEVLETLLELPLNVYAIDNSYNQHVKMPRLNSWLELEDLLKR
ncbi:5' nucleotidase, NT5C type [Neobacillus sp. D3-1R]|uniref:5' nucleotidase, NT5C type n=1 Tax=Neobacillus sp. D3-1R TaxID=3445778 RepID=UPI003F9F8823